MGAAKTSAPNVKFAGSGGSKGLFGAIKGGAGGLFSAIPRAVGMTSGGKATFSGDSFSKKDQEGKETPKGDEFRTFKVRKDLDYESTKKRLLELAKEEAIKTSRSKDMEKEIYDRSLPNVKDGNETTAEMFLGKDYKKNVQKTIDNLPTPLQGMFGSG
tara:strand:+ start:40 stop:513 length:474 start_codon:yes stop_codon:yes gene_type:complete